MFVEVNDQPGRVVAVFIVSPILAKKGRDYEDFFITSFAFALFIWDGFWLIAKPPKKY